jgi:3-hydroxybutyryl-CoA dehydrogenase
MSFTIVTDIDDRPVTVIGAGTLGRRIALMFAVRGGTVRIVDPSTEQSNAAVRYVQDNIASVAAKIDGDRPGQAVAVADLATALDSSWLAVEAVPERLELKKQVFADLDRLASADAILASNSSSYASRLFLGGVRHPERVLNTHFYMPPTQNAVDVMSCGQTDRQVIDFVLAVFPTFGVYPFEAHRESTGFIFNRVWAAIKRETLELVAEGVSTPQDVDRMFQVNTGMPGGPFRLMDQVGLDVVLDIEEHYAAEHPEYPWGPRTVLRDYIDRGRLGVKSGAGFYDDYPS